MKSTNKISRLSAYINAAVAGPSVKPLEAKNSISPKGELLLYGVIGDWWDGMDALSIVRELEQLSGPEIIVRIQSPGGNVTEGLAMYNRLKQSPKKVIVYIDGVAASMGAGIAMAGDEVHIPTNALMMLHKPALDNVGGNENDLRDAADALAKIEQSYVQIHADKTGKPNEEIKALIADGKNHFFVGQEAVDYGLADFVIGGVQLNATACMKFSGMDIPQKITASLFTQPAAAAATQPEEENMFFKIKAKAGGWHFVPAINAALNGTFAKIEDAVAALKGTVAVANLADILAGKAEADDDVLKAIAKHFAIDLPQAPAAPAGAASPATAQAGDDAVVKERARVKDVSAIAAQAKVGDELLQKWIHDGVSAADARAQALEAVAKRDASGAPQSYVRTAGSVGREGMRAAMANALLNRVDPGKHKLTDNARDFRGMTIMGMVSAAMEADGQSVRGKTPNELLAQAMHTTSDFPLILQDVANITLRNAYENAPKTYPLIAVQTSASDFKSKHSVQIGGGSGLEKVNESGEFKHGTVSEGGESYALDTYGRIFDFSRQLLINDNIGALTRFMNQVGALAGRKENSIVWNLVKSNPLLSDGVAVYSTASTRKNQVAGASINETTLNLARVAMRQMVGLDGEPISVSPKFLVVNSTRETEAEKAVIVVQPDSTANANVFANKMQIVVEPILDGVANNPFYFFADPNAMPVIEYCFLDGESGPYIETKWGFEVDGMSLKVRHDFGAGYVDFRGTVKGAGA
jgi:ATP-dependent protease ClpP protease subunit